MNRVATAVALAGALLTLPLAATAVPRPVSAPVDPRPSSSDGLRGTSPRAPLSRVDPVVTGQVTRTVVPGLVLDTWTETDARGPNQVYALTADLGTPGLTLRYAAMPTVRQVARLPRILRQDAAVAGVNADFFDIHDTGAPLGVGVDEGRVLHGPRQGWTHSLVVRRDGALRIKEAPVVVRVRHRPGIRVTNLNSPTVAPQGIGLYTPAWGEAAGYRVVDGARRRDVRQVVVRDGRVRSTSRRLTADHPVDGWLLVGRGHGAVALARLHVGDRVRFTTTVAGSPRVVVSGSEELLAAGTVLATDDTALAPRTAVGIDRDTGHLLLVVVDGRSDVSRGMTLVELARLLGRLGAEYALNLDGGGSSTMVAADDQGTPRVVNVPSDGAVRKVANGLELTYTP